MRKASATIVTILALAGLVAGMHPAFAASSEESDFLSQTNYERTSRGLRGVTLDAHLSDIARRHSQEMANQHDLHHNDNLGNEVEGWEELDENVGVGRSVGDIHDAFMASGVHRAGILGNYEKVGIGTVIADGEIWVTEIFFRAKRTSSTTTATRRTATTTRRVSTPARPRTAVVRAAAAPKPVPVPVAPAPKEATVAVLTSGKLEKLLGDLAIAGEAAAEEAAEAAPAGQPRLAAVVWQFVEADAS